VNHTIRGEGLVTTRITVNRGNIEADVAGSSLTMQNGTVNSGVLRAIGEGTLVLDRALAVQRHLV